MPKLPSGENLNNVPFNAVKSFTPIPNVDIEGAANSLASGISRGGRAIGNAFAEIQAKRDEEYQRSERFHVKMRLLEAEDQYNQKAQTLDPLADDYPDQVVNTWDDAIKGIMTDIKDPDNKRFFGENLLQNRFTLKTGAGDKQKVAREDKTVLDLETYVDQSRKKIREYADDPENIYKNVEQMIADAPVDDKKKALMREKLLPKLDEDILTTKALGMREGGVGGGSSAEKSAALLRKFEGYRDSPYWDVNAYRVGYGSDTITRADGSIIRVKKGDRVNRDDAERDLARRVGEFQQRAAKDAGDAWGLLNADQQAALTSVAYNYGSLPKRVVTAIQTGDANAIANAVESLADHNAGINRKRREQEAAVIRGSSGVPAGGPVGGQSARPSKSEIMTQLEADPAFQRMNVDQQDAVRSRINTQLSKVEEEDKTAQAFARAEMKTRLESDLKSIADTGTPDETLTVEQVAAVATPTQLAEWVEKREVQKIVWDATNQFPQMAEAQIVVSLNDMRSQLEGLKGTPKYGIVQKAITAAEAKHRELKQRREEDPFTAAEYLPGVREYIEALTDPRLSKEGEPLAPRNEKIIETVMDAQRRFGFKREADIAPLPKQKAIEIGTHLQRVGFDAAAMEETDSLAAAELVRGKFKQLQSIYGKYTPDVIAYSLGVVSTMSRDDRELLVDTLSALGSGQKLSAEKAAERKARREAQQQQAATNGWGQRMFGWLGGDEEEETPAPPPPPPEQEATTDQNDELLRLNDQDEFEADAPR
jgi:GH24 family phage-related lysozyme (muramidase)